MLFSRNIDLISPLDEKEVIYNLKKVTEKHFTNKHKKFKFEGSIAKNSFLIYPTFNYGSRFRLRPEIEGVITKHSDHNNLIKLSFRLSTEFKILLISILILNIIFITYIYFNPIDKHLLTWKLYLIGLIITGLMFSLGFHYKTQKSIYILMNLFNVKHKE